MFQCPWKQIQKSIQILMAQTIHDHITLSGFWCWTEMQINVNPKKKVHQFVFKLHLDRCFGVVCQQMCINIFLYLWLSLQSHIHEYIGVHVCIYMWQLSFSASNQTRNKTLCELRQSTRANTKSTHLHMQTTLTELVQVNGQCTRHSMWTTTVNSCEHRMDKSSHANSTNQISSEQWPVYFAILYKTNSCKSLQPTRANTESTQLRTHTTQSIRYV